MLRISALAFLLTACSTPGPPGAVEIGAASSPEALEASAPPADDIAEEGAAEVGATPPRIVFIGASVSAGYGTYDELGTRRDLDLATFASAFLADGSGAPELIDHSQRWFYTNADHHGRQLVTLALDEQPDAVVAVDFLFWYAFGIGAEGDPRRMRGLESGLDVLDRVEAPLVIGDLPDIDHALRGEGPFGGPIVHRALFPTEEERLRMNARIRRWADEREDAVVVSLEDFTADAVALEGFAIRGNEWRPGSLGDVLQSDLLHPTTRGTLWVALAALDGLVELGVLDEESVDWSVEAADERLAEIAEPLLKSPREGAGAAGD